MQNAQKIKSSFLLCLLSALLLLAATFVPQTVHAATQNQAFPSQSMSQSGTDDDSGETVSISERAAPMAAPAQTGGGHGFAMVLIAVCALGLGTAIFAVRRRLPHKEEADG